MLLLPVCYSTFYRDLLASDYQIDNIFLGLTGFDSKDDGFVSMSGYTDCPVKTFCKILIGENNFALAA